MWLALPLSLKWMGQGMAVCSLGDMHTFYDVVWLLLCRSEVQPSWVEPAWAMALYCPKGVVQRILEAQTGVSHRTVASLDPLRSGLCHQSTEASSLL